MQTDWCYERFWRDCRSPRIKIENVARSLQKLLVFVALSSYSWNRHADKHSQLYCIPCAATPRGNKYSYTEGDIQPAQACQTQPEFGIHRHAHQLTCQYICSSIKIKWTRTAIVALWCAMHPQLQLQCLKFKPQKGGKKGRSVGESFLQKSIHQKLKIFWVNN